MLAYTKFFFKIMDGKTVLFNSHSTDTWSLSRGEAEDVARDTIKSLGLSPYLEIKTSYKHIYLPKWQVEQMDMASKEINMDAKHAQHHYSQMNQ